MQQIRCLIIDDMRATLKGLEDILAEIPSIRLLESLERIPAKQDQLEGRPDVVLLDWRDVGSDTPVAATLRVWPRARVIVRTVLPCPCDVIDAIGQGAFGYIDGNAYKEAYRDAIETAHNHHFYLNPFVARTIRRADGADPSFGLTARQRELLDLIADGAAAGNAVAGLGLSQMELQDEIDDITESVQRTQASRNRPRRDLTPFEDRVRRELRKGSSQRAIAGSGERAAMRQVYKAVERIKIAYGLTSTHEISAGRPHREWCCGNCPPVSARVI